MNFLKIDVLFNAWVNFSRDLYKRSRKWKICNPYSKFANMTKFRWEIIIEGTYHPSSSSLTLSGSTNGSDWKEYEFQYKPSREDKMPPFIPGYMPSLDWQLWFIPLGLSRGLGLEQYPWYLKFIQCLYKNNPNVLALLGNNPFPSMPDFLTSLIF